MPGITTALLVGSAIAAGSQVAQGVIGSKGAKSAAKTQAEASTQAANTQAASAREAQGRLDTVMAPYVNTGAQAMTSLGGLMGIPQGGPLKPGGMGGAVGGGVPGATSPQVMNNPQLGGAGAAPGGYSGNSPYASAGTYPNYAPQSDPQTAAMQQSASSYGGQNGAPKLVTMRAPTGETQVVPEAQVAHFTQLGAQIVS